jgi:GT2 family glycosyltransferase
MTVFNGEKYLNESLRSLSNQAMEDWDLVVVENGSSDSTAEILSKYTDPRIRVINLPENIGRTPALNMAVVNASAKYVAVLDADDLSHPLRLKHQIEFLDAHPDVGLVGSWAEFIDEVGLFVSLKKGPISHQEIVQAMATRNPIVHSSAMFRRDLMGRIGGYDETLVYAQDFGMLLEFARISRIAVIPEILCSWRKLNNGMTYAIESTIIRARDEADLFARVPKMVPLTPTSRMLNYKQQILTRLILSLCFARKRQFKYSINSLIFGILEN